VIDIGSIAGGLASLKAAKDIAESLVNLRDTAKFQGAVVELQGKILSAQSDQFSLLERVRELEAKIEILEAWELEKNRYRLKDYGGGTFAFELIPEKANGEPIHRACPNCFQKGQLSILQYKFRTAHQQDRYMCPGCKTEFDFGPWQPRQRQPVTRYSSGF
jgi:hypothetical protein